MSFQNSTKSENYGGEDFNFIFRIALYDNVLHTSYLLRSILINISLVSYDLGVLMNGFDKFNKYFFF